MRQNVALTCARASSARIRGVHVGSGPSSKVRATVCRPGATDRGGATWSGVPGCVAGASDAASDADAAPGDAVLNGVDTGTSRASALLPWVAAHDDRRGAADATATATTGVRTGAPSVRSGDP